MERDLLIKHTTERITLLPDNKLRELANFLEFLLQKKANQELNQDLTKLASSSAAFDFLEEEEELYGDSDLIEKF